MFPNLKTKIFAVFLFLPLVILSPHTTTTTINSGPSFCHMVRIPNTPAGNISWIDFSANGQYLAFAAGDGKTHIYETSNWSKNATIS